MNQSGQLPMAVVVWSGNCGKSKIRAVARRARELKPGQAMAGPSEDFRTLEIEQFFEDSMGRPSWRPMPESTTSEVHARGLVILGLLNDYKIIPEEEA